VAGMRAYRIPFSTNVERVALALAHKGLEVEWVDVDPSDRSPVVEVSGQELVPVLVTDDGEVLADSPRILRWIEASWPQPPLLPADEHERAAVEVFCDWFNRVWKRPPNLIADGRGSPELVAELEGSMDVFSALLHGRDYLFGDFSLADVTAFPFLRYALGMRDDDTDRFHAVLHEHLPLAGHPRVAEWIRRVDRLPRA
jgi:glutathione S-transferase